MSSNCLAVRMHCHIAYICLTFPHRDCGYYHVFVLIIVFLRKLRLRHSFCNIFSICVCLSRAKNTSHHSVIFYLKSRLQSGLVVFLSNACSDSLFQMCIWLYFFSFLFWLILRHISGCSIQNVFVSLLNQEYESPFYCWSFQNVTWQFFSKHEFRSVLFLVFSSSNVTYQ